MSRQESGNFAWWISFWLVCVIRWPKLSCDCNHPKMSPLCKRCLTLNASGIVKQPSTTGIFAATGSQSQRTPPRKPVICCAYNRPGYIVRFRAQHWNTTSRSSPVAYSVNAFDHYKCSLGLPLVRPTLGTRHLVFLVHTGSAGSLIHGQDIGRRQRSRSRMVYIGLKPCSLG